MEPETTAIFSFAISLIAYGWLGFLWLLYDAEFSLSGLTSTQSSLVIASKIQTLGFVTFLAALGTAIVVYYIEGRVLTVETSPISQQ